MFITKALLKKLCWDDPVPDKIQSEWLSFRKFFASLNDSSAYQLRGHIDVQLHGFSNASFSGYGACIYLRSIDANERVHVQILRSSCSN